MRVWSQTSAAAAHIPLSTPAEPVPWLLVCLIMVPFSTPALGEAFRQPGCWGRLRGSVPLYYGFLLPVRKALLGQGTVRSASVCGPSHLLHFWQFLSECPCCSSSSDPFLGTLPPSPSSRTSEEVSLQLSAWFKFLLSSSGLPHKSTEVVGQLFLFSRAFCENWRPSLSRAHSRL